MTGQVRPQEAGSEQAPDLQDAHIVPFGRDSNGKPKDKAAVHIGGYLRARHPVPTTLCDQRQAGVPQAYQPLSAPGTSYVIASWGAS